MPRRPQKPKAAAAAAVAASAVDRGAASVLGGEAETVSVMGT